MKDSETKILLIGIGNSGRSDDGLGWAFLDAVKDDLPENFQYEYRYQLQIEDAELISNYDVVYFIDAHLASFREGFQLEECKSESNGSFTTHQLDPQTVLYLCENMYNSNPKACIMGISGYDFDLKLGLTEEARANLNKAVSYFETCILKLTLKE